MYSHIPILAQIWSETLSKDVRKLVQTEGKQPSWWFSNSGQNTDLTSRPRPSHMARSGNEPIMLMDGKEFSLATHSPWHSNEK